MKTIVYAIYKDLAVNGELTGENRQVCVKADSEVGRSVRDAVKGQTGLSLEMATLPLSVLSHGIKIIRIG